MRAPDLETDSTRWLLTSSIRRGPKLLAAAGGCWPGPPGLGRANPGAPGAARRGSGAAVEGAEGGGPPRPGRGPGAAVEGAGREGPPRSGGGAPRGWTLARGGSSSRRCRGAAARGGAGGAAWGWGGCATPLRDGPPGGSAWPGGRGGDPCWPAPRGGGPPRGGWWGCGGWPRGCFLARGSWLASCSLGGGACAAAGATSAPAAKPAAMRAASEMMRRGAGWSTFTGRLLDRAPQISSTAEQSGKPATWRMLGRIRDKSFVRESPGRPRVRIDQRSNGPISR